MLGRHVRRIIYPTKRFDDKIFCAYMGLIARRRRKNISNQAERDAAQELQGKESSAQVPLTGIFFSADVAGLFAQVACTQEFVNRCEKPIEAIYVFPLPEEASVVGCEMQIGEKTIRAELKEKKEARKQYDDAVAAGHHTTLLEQKRTNIFTMNVGGIEPGEKIKVTLTYNQRAPWQQGGGRFTIPLVVAPRFIPGTPTGKSEAGWAEDTDEVPDASHITPVVSKEGVSYTASVNVRLNAGFPCVVTSPSHGLLLPQTSVEAHQSKEIMLQDLVPDRDFVLCYRTDSASMESVAHRGAFDGEAFATVTIVPPSSVTPRPIDVIFCLDVSGSMTGAKIEGLKLVAEKAAHKLISQHLDHRVGIVAFESEVHPVHPLSKLSDQTISVIRRLTPMGGTYAGKALDYCFSVLEGEDSGGREKYILFVTDGQTEDHWRKIARGVRVISVGIDVAANLEYLRDIARQTGGTSIAIYPGEDYDAAASTLIGLLSGPVLRTIKLLVSDEPVAEVLGIADVYQGMPAVLSFKKAGALPRLVTVTGTATDNRQVRTVLDLARAKNIDFLHRVWAREKLRSDLSEKEQLAISLKYGVLCAQTAFVAVHYKEVPGQKPERVEVPVALPHTWDYDAVFEAAATMLGPVPASKIVACAMPEESLTSAFIRRMARRLSASPQAPAQPKPLADLVDALEELVAQIEQSAVQRAEAEQRWVKLQKKIRAEIRSWSPAQKAKCFYFLLKLQVFGFAVAAELLHEVSVQPDVSDTEAYEWWQKAQKFGGKLAGGREAAY